MYTCKNEMKQYENDLEFQWFTKVLKISFVFVRFKSTYIIIHRIFAQITSIYCLKQIFNNVQKICIETFLLILHSHL